MRIAVSKAGDQTKGLNAREEPFAKLVANAMASGGDIDSRSAVTQRMLREMESAEKEHYKKQQQSA